MYPFTVDCLAMCDVEEARRYYDVRRRGLGQQFAEAVAGTFEQIAEHPLRQRRVWRQFRKCKVPSFPFGVIYRFDGTTVDILVVMHLARNPAQWKKLAGERGEEV